ncbi:hypothetical protein [Flavobacterium sp. N1994]|uniref:hypothetical protein n=1 Tax=Flavobacterium sp. N1994 TaxID=2986827 RepID=UPI002223E5AA|nr:hypothetical protein [Flavobacterium sp. N1994]
MGSCGSYTFTYRICEILNPNNCDEATVTVVIQDLIAPTFTAPANMKYSQQLIVLSMHR